MLSQIPWTHFWMFIVVAVMLYYLIVGFVYFREEALSLVAGKGMSKKPVTPSNRSVAPDSVIGHVDHAREEPGQNGAMQTQENNNDIINKKLVIIDNINNIASDSPEVTPISDELSVQINYSLLEPEDDFLSAEFIARVNAGLEDEELEGPAFSTVTEIPGEEVSTMDSEDFFQLIQAGIGKLNSDRPLATTFNAMSEGISEEEKELDENESDNPSEGGLPAWGDADEVKEQLLRKGA